MESTHTCNVSSAALTLDELFNMIPAGISTTIPENFVKAWSYINSHQKCLCSISGGSDSDVVMDILSKVDKDHKVEYVWFNTGMEMSATMKHLDFLEQKYGIKIRRERPKKPIPLACKQYGQPFLNKRASEYMFRLQSHNFQWEDEDIQILRERYCEKATGELKAQFDAYYEATGETPKDWALRNGEWYSGVISALEWWCNCSIGGGENSQCNISHNKWLKEFIIQNPPTFKISAKCCTYAKKNIAHNLVKREGYDLSVTGVRKAEGGARATAYKSCFSKEEFGCDNYRPIFWYKDSDKRDYEKAFNVVHSDCYTRYGMLRTGCSGCPCSRTLDEELATLQKWEPMLYKAANTVFKDTYAYTKKYHDFQKEMDLKTKMNGDGYEQMTILDYIK